MKKILNLLLIGIVAVFAASCGSNVNVPDVDGDPAVDVQTLMTILKENNQKVQERFDDLTKPSIKAVVSRDKENEPTFKSRKEDETEKSFSSLANIVIDADNRVAAFIEKVEKEYADSAKLSEFANLLNEEMAKAGLEWSTPTKKDSKPTTVTQVDTTQVPDTTEQAL